MDKITQTFLREFVELNNLESREESEQFEHFASYLTLRRYYADQFDTDEIVTGAGGDTGIDGFAVLVNGKLVTDKDELEDFEGGYLDVSFDFIQAERTSGFDTAKIGTFEYGVLDFFKDEPTLRRNEKVKKAVELMNAILAKPGLFKRGNPVCRLHYVTTGTWVDDANLVARKETAIANLRATQLFRNVEFFAVGAAGIQTLVRQAKNDIEREFVFERRAVLPEIPDVKQAFIGFLPATEFLKVITSDSGELMHIMFEENPRDFLGSNSVNIEIRETLSTEKKTRFVLMNNGITIIASSLIPTGDRFVISGYSIVNGCQTSHVLYEARDSLDSTVAIPVRLIITEDEEVINDIIRATNRQTEVKDEQFFALSQFSKRLEVFFKSFPDPNKLYYERRSFQYARQAIEKTRIVTAANAIRAFASMFLGEPHRTTKNYTSLKKRVGRDIFGEDHKLDPYYVASLAAYKVEKAFRTGRLDAKYKPARYHLLMAIRYLTNANPLPRFNSNEMERYCRAMLEKLQGDGVDTLIGQASEVIDRAASGDFERDSIRTEAFTQSVVKKLSAYQRLERIKSRLRDRPVNNK